MNERNNRWSIRSGSKSSMNCIVHFTRSRFQEFRQKKDIFGDFIGKIILS